MLRRLFLFFLTGLLLLSSLSADAFMGRTKENDDLYFHRHNRSHRVDPRLRFLHSRKKGNCLRSTVGVCSLQEEEKFSDTRYQNGFRLKQEQKLKKIRPWL